VSGLLEKMPAVVNAASGTAEQAKSALEAAGAFETIEVAPTELEKAISAAAAGAPRILVAGGDGTIGTAATLLLGGETELAILPGGTLNHFAHDLGISTEPMEALELALHGSARPADVGMVDEQIFLNTSSVGAYVRFVRMREYLEHRRFSYRLASAIAAFRLLFQFRLVAVELEVDGNTRIYRTPLVFIGVGERELQLPTLGNRVAGGKRGLHVMIVTGRTRARVLAIALSAVARGVATVSRTPAFDSFIVDRCTITRRHRGDVAVDGELVPLDADLHYELRRDAVKVVCP
jgi:diacylglycerol kinase family enzyme